MSQASPAPAGPLHDTVPYVNYAHPLTHPRWLETMATLFGMQPAPISQCSMLELGCAAGGNLLPLAAELPNSRFVGVDASERQVADGQQAVAALGLKNVELRCADPLAVDDSWGQFDYIASHGLFSWMPPAGQDQLLAVSAQNLNPHGVAYVGYNTYPGWHLAAVARDAMVYHTKHITDPGQKVTQSRAIVDFLREASDAGSAIHKVLETERQLLEHVGDMSYFLHEHLAPDNHPIYFHQFLARAEAQGLQFLVEGELATSVLQNYPPKVRDTLRNLTMAQQEQYFDFIIGRRLRNSLLCHREIALQRALSPALMRNFHFALNGPLEVTNVDIRNNQQAQFKLRSSTLVSSDRLTKAAMMYSKEVYPQQVSFADLCAATISRAGVAESEAATAAESLAVQLLQALLADFFAVAVHPYRCTAKAGAKPLASTYVRWQAEQGGLPTNARHQTVRLAAYQRRLLRSLDGQHDHQQLLEVVREAITAGEVTVSDQTDRLLKRVSDDVANDILTRTLDELAGAGLLLE
jgi:methyltransferase-like protein